MKKRVLLFVAVGLLLAVFRPFSAQHRICAETAEKIEVGMTVEEVIDILGAPPGDYGPGQRPRLFFPSVTCMDVEACETLFHEKSMWWANDFLILVTHENGKVSGIFAYELPRLEGWIEKIAGWFGRIIP